MADLRLAQHQVATQYLLDGGIRVDFSDKTLTCRECSKPFTWTAGEQQFFREKALINIPARCPQCRSARKAKLGLPDRAQTDVICAGCNRATTVPFVPRNGNPVYCSACFAKAREAAASRELAEVANTPA